MANRNSTCSVTRTGTTLRVALYARVSTTDQSTESQLLDLRRYVSDRGWQTFREYCDNGISGTKDSRPAAETQWIAPVGIQYGIDINPSGKRA